METNMHKKLTKEEVAQQALNIFYNKYPGFLEKYGEKEKQRSFEDWMYHLSYLESAILANEPKLFTDYLAWCKMFFKSIKFPLEHVVESLGVLVDIYERNHSENSHKKINYLKTGLHAFDELPGEINTFIDVGSKLGVYIAKKIIEAHDGKFGPKAKLAKELPFTFICQLINVLQLNQNHGYKR